MKNTNQWLLTALLPVVLLANISQISVSTLSCKRMAASQGTCKLVYSTITGKDIREIPLSTLKEAKVSDGSKIKPLILVTEADEILLTHSRQDLEPQEEMAAQINAFIRNPHTTSLLLRSDERLYSCIYSILAVALCIVHFGELFRKRGYMSYGTSQRMGKAR